MRFSLLILFLCLLVASCDNPPYEKLDDGVLLRIKGDQAKQVKLQVISDKIIRVVASPTDTFSKEKSLVVLPQAEKAEWKISEGEDKVILSTKSLQASVSLSTGEVIFSDSTGRQILSEKQGGGKYFEQTKVENNDFFKIRQVFGSTHDEAFYGLGGHQNGQVNYKAQDVEMAQHNIVDVIPFLYSSKNYGILWDNYSISKFGDPRDYQQLTSLKTFSVDGKEGGLTANYYVGDKIIETKQESSIDREFLETPQVDNFSKDVSYKGKVVWEGSLASDIEGDHKFVVYSAGYVKVWIDDQLIIEKWR
jgi:alpha-D-xyloside xylohydrolase